MVTVYQIKTLLIFYTQIIDSHLTLKQRIFKEDIY